MFQERLKTGVDMPFGEDGAMAKYKYYDYSQTKLIPVSLEDQLRKKRGRTCSVLPPRNIAYLRTEIAKYQISDSNHIEVIHTWIIRNDKGVRRTTVKTGTGLAKTVIGKDID